MKTFTFKTWGGSRRRIEADHVTFEPSGHVVFRERRGIYENDRIVLAVTSAQCNDLTQEEVATGG